jgi:uncharacterized protein YpmB
MTVNKRNNVSKLTFSIMLVLVLALVLTSGYLFMQNKKLKTNNNEAADLKAKVSKIIDLPSENPVVGTVEDKDKFKDQPFFNGVENGDKLLIFTEAKKAVIYREKDNKLINVGPLAVSAEGSQDADPKQSQ